MIQRETTPEQQLRASFEDARAVLEAFMKAPDGFANVPRFAQAALETVRQGGLLMAIGNGGSMSDAMHFAEEWTGRFRGNRRPVPAIAFSDPAAMTCIANDFGYDEVFARQVEAHGKRGDLLVAISTSGNSPNVLRACEVARGLGVATVGLLGKGGGQLKAKVDVPIVVPYSASSDRIQEVHIKVLHNVIEVVERALFPENYEAKA
jgi:D-sedoheptulose 7-phosphate isomerase